MPVDMVMQTFSRMRQAIVAHRHFRLHNYTSNLKHKQLTASYYLIKYRTVNHAASWLENLIEKILFLIVQQSIW